jgi:hypothetical protein
MYRFIVLMLVISSALMLSGCGNKVADAAKSFTGAIEKQDFAGAKDFASEESADLLNQAQFYWDQLSVAEKEEVPLKKYNIVDTSVSGETAVVTLDEIDAQDRSRKETREIKMLKEEGIWKVSLDTESESMLPGGGQ